ncbi:TIR domain-containing protein [Nitrobacter sp. TKz-YC02]|uniref:TIR domain-containing protein n=1 Tax=Nitrobacter sp. TKz-YC02 TaxID=3398704 RepID=UPI003CF44967
MADVFISYSRDDDLPSPAKPDGKGFVTFLDDAVRYEFKELGPQRPKIWRDTKRIADGDQFTPEIEEALKGASFLLVVLSPNWMASRWCRKELDTFIKYHGFDRERVVVVGKRHVDADKRPSLLQGQNGFRFYVRNEDPEEIVGDLEFFDRGEPRDARYWERLKALAAYLVKRQPRPSQEPMYAPTGRTIFVAKPASDMRMGYDRVVSELIGKGHTVVPESTEDIPLDSAVKVIDAALSNAEIAVHLLGEKAGNAPEDQLPMVKLQLARAAARASRDHQGKFHRVVWAPTLWTVLSNADQPPSEITRRPLEVLAKFDRQLAMDKIEGDSLSKFVDFLNQHLSVIAPPRSITLTLSDICGDTRLFLYHSREDSQYALTLAQALQQRKIEPLLPAFEGPEADIKNFNSKQLAECDGVIVCWASASEVWVRAQTSGLRNWGSLGRSQQFCYRAVVAAPPPGERKKASKLLFPRSEVDLVVDLSDKDILTADLLDLLVPTAHANAA